MARARAAADTAAISVNFSAAEKRMLTRRSRDAGQPLAEYIRECVLVEAGCEEQILRFLADELTRTAEDARRAVAEGQVQTEASIEECHESPVAQRNRIAKEARGSLTQRELDSLARFFNPAFDARLWPEPPSANQREAP